MTRTAAQAARAQQAEALEQAMKALVQAEAEMLLLKRFIVEPGTDPLAWADSVEAYIGTALGHLRQLGEAGASALLTSNDASELVRLIQGRADPSDIERERQRLALLTEEERQDNPSDPDSTP